MKNQKEKFFQLVQQAGFPIGSRAWGGYKEDSDYDIVISETTYEKILKAAKNNYLVLNIDRLFNAYGDLDHILYNTINDKMDINGKCLNVIAYKDEDISKVRAMNEGMLALKGTAIGDMMATDKKYRIQVFQNFKEIMFPEKCYCVGFDCTCGVAECNVHPKEIPF